MPQQDSVIGTIRAYDENLNLVTDRYSQNHRLAIQVVSEDGEPFGVLTTNLPNVQLAADEIIVKTIDENEPMREPALASGLFEDTGRRVQSGFSQFEVWRLVTAG